MKERRLMRRVIDCFLKASERVETLFVAKIAGILIFTSMLFTHLAFAVEPKMTSYVDTIRILKISPQDERAVIKAGDGDMRVIRVGDVIGGVPNDNSKELKVVEIAEGRVVFEEKTEKETETIIVRLEGEKQKIERISRSGPKTHPLRAPIILEGADIMKKEGNPFDSEQKALEGK